MSASNIAQDYRLALELPGAAGLVFNVDSNRHHAARNGAEKLYRQPRHTLGRRDICPEITQRCRTGDNRHCFADILLACRVLGCESRVTLKDGMAELLPWLGT
jgi:dTDP-L-rhamnose 4-epimerase